MAFLEAGTWTKVVRLGGPIALAAAASMAGFDALEAIRDATATPCTPGSRKCR